MNSKIKFTNPWILISLLFGVILIALLGVQYYLVSQEVKEQEEKPAIDESLIPTEFPLVVHYIDKKPKDINVSEVEDILSGIESLPIPLKMQDVTLPHGGGSTYRLELKAFHNGEWIYFLFAWKDNTKDVKVVKNEQYRDAVAILFPLTEVSAENLFSPRMGDIDKIVNIWHWKADWEEDMRGIDSENRLEEIYPNAVLQKYEGVMSELDKTAGGLGGGNLLSAPSRKSPVEDLNAAKFGTLTSQAHQDVYGHGVWSKERWVAVMARKLQTPDENDAQFIPGRNTYFSPAVWNGSSGERDGQKSVSDRWHPLEIEPVEE